MSFTANMFPLEIFDSIIDFLAADDDQSFTSVKASSLVSRRFLPRARTHIFSSITIDGQSRTLSFTRLVSHTPAISYYVKSFHYFVERSDLVADGFAAALRSLIRLKSLTIDIIAFRVKWCDIPSEYQEAILTLMHLPGLSHLHLDEPSLFPLSSLALCVGLRSLRIDSATVATLSKDIELYHEEVPRLETFMGIGNCENLLMQLCTARRTDGKLAIDISGLKKLTLSMEYNKPKTLTFFEHCTQLTDVHLYHLYYKPDIFIAELLIPSLRTLRYIHLEFQSRFNPEQLIALVSDFQSIAGKNTIEKIRITIEAVPYATLTDGYDWGAFDKVFTQSHSGWEKLNTLSLSFRVQTHEGRAGRFLRELWELPKTQLRNLVKSMDDHFDFEVVNLDWPAENRRRTSRELERWFQALLNR